jgi:hypothetical protein
MKMKRTHKSAQPLNNRILGRLLATELSQEQHRIASGREGGENVNWRKPVQSIELQCADGTAFDGNWDCNESPVVVTD